MITLGASSGRLQASRAQVSRSGRPAVPRGYRSITRQQLQQRRRIVAAAAGRDDGDNPLRFDDRSTSEVPSDMAPGLKDQQTGKLKGGPADLMAGRDVESSDTNPAMDLSEQSKVAKMEGSGTNMAQPRGSGTNMAQSQSSGSGGSSSSTRDMSDQSSAQGTGGSGGAAVRFDDRSTSQLASDMASPGLQEQQTGKLAGGPADMSVGRDVESSDTNPAMDPSEQSKIAGREGSGTNEAQTQFRTSESDSPGSSSLRDMSDQASAQGTGGFGGTEDSSITEQRSHPAARTTGTAIGSAVGTVLGAVGGPITAAAGAALGASAGRGLTDLLSGTSSKEQAEIYEQGAEPEQVLEEVMGAGSDVKHAAQRVGEGINGRAESALDKAESLLRDAEAKADARRKEGKHKAEKMGDKASQKVDQTSSDLKGRTRSDESSGHSEGGSGRGSSDTAGGKAGGGLFGAMEAAIHKVEKLTGEIDLPEYPELDNIGTKVDSKGASSASSGQRGGDVGDRLETGADRMSEKAQQTSSDLKERTRSDESSGSGSGGGSVGGKAGGALFGAIESAANKLEGVTGDIALPEFPDLDNIGTKVDQGSKGSKSGSAAGSDAIVEGGWAPSDATAAAADATSSIDRKASSNWVGDWGSEAATSAAASQGLSTPSAQGAVGEGASAGGSGLGGLGDAEAVVKADVGAPMGADRDASSGSLIMQDGMNMTSAASAEGWKPEGVGKAGGVAAAGGYGSESSGMGDAGYQADQGRSAGGASMQPASAVGNAGQQMEGSGGKISGGVGEESGERADFEAGGGLLDGVAGRVSGIDDVSASLLEDINSLSAVAGASYEGMSGMSGQGSGTQGQGADVSMGQGSGSSVGQGSGSGMEGIPEGRLRVGGEDAQAAESVDGASSQAAITSDSAAARVEQVFGVGPEASPGAAEADLYQKEAKQEGGDDHSQTAKQEGGDDRSQTA